MANNSMANNAASQKQPQIFPLSHGQQAMWFLYQIAPQSVAYNIFITVRLCGELDLGAWHRAWQKIVESHSILRTTYTERDGQPFQVVHPDQEVDIQVIDASLGSEDYLRKQILAQTDKPFNLESDRVLRVRLFTRSPQEHIQLLSMHHIAGDMWSFDILLNELQIFYAAAQNSVSDRILPLPRLSYTDYIHWQSEILASSRGEQLSTYWHKQLAGELPLLDLPLDKPRSRVQTYNGAYHLIELDRELRQKLRQLADSQKTSLYTTLLAAFFVLLYRYTGQEDILVGSPMAGRSARKGFKEIVGYFTDPVILRAFIAGNPTFLEFLAQVHRTVFGALRHQDYPFSLLVKQLVSQRDASRPLLFQVTFTWQKHRWYEQTQNLSLEPEKPLLLMEPYLIAGHQRGAAFDIDLAVVEAGNSLQLCWQYNTDLFDAAAIARMAENYQILLEGILSHPEQRVSELPLLTPAERHQLLFDWNNIKVEYPQDKCIHQLFEEQVRRTPNAIAVEFGTKQLTYNELNQRANKLAHYLQTLGVKPEVLVAICVERSLFMLIGILGILKAGGAYVPLDPAYPSERLAYILSDSQVQVLLTQENLLAALPNDTAELLCLDTNWVIISTQGEENPHIEVQASNLAYVIYTSGSTGQPKGVMIEHRSLVNFTQAFTDKSKINNRNAYGGQSLRFLQFLSISFDGAAAEIYPCLLCGGTLVIATSEVFTSVTKFLQKSEEWQISVWILPTAYWHQLTSELAWTQKLIPPSIRLVTIGGEAAQEQTLRLWQKSVDEKIRSHQLGEPPLLINCYGPSETTVVATTLKLSDFLNVSDPQTLLPIGKPIANIKTYILDRYQQPVPIGVLGELYIGGKCLARGYLNRPDLTAEKFINCTFQKSQRLYKTGDLARYLPDGKIEFRGRIDRQVKIRGFRIELYTSGSTGQPKGVMIEHHSLANFTHAARYDYGIGKRDCVLQFASISFDAAAAEIYPCLTCGGKLVLSTSDIYTSIAKFLQKSQDWQISVWILPTAYWHQLTSELSFTQELIPPSIRLVFIGGEAAQEQTLRLWQKSVDERIRSQRQEEPPLLFNVYGPSETTVDATAFKFLQLPPSDRHFILPIGRPISNVKAYILDRYQQPVPIGVLGELYIGGKCLARGYLNRPDLTAEKFINCTFQKSQRLYKTGDLARYLPDGKIEFRGRIDRQVKIRGFRIELGEVETVLTTHPQVEDVVVIDSEDVPGSKRLIAYVVAYEQSSFKNQLRDYLKQKLPDYMIPSAFVILESLPLTPNGKVDRQALLAYQVNNDANTFVLPRTSTEKVLAKIWQDVLNLEQVSVFQNFFELGGDSIISIQIIARAHQAGLQITTKQLFQHQTIAELAIATANTTTSIVAEQGLVTGIVPLTPIQDGFFEENWTEPHHFNQSMLLVVPPDLKPELLEQGLQELLVHHDALRMRFVRDELGWQQQNSDDCQQVPFQFIDLSSLAEEEHQAAIEQQANQLQTTLNLAQGPLLRAVLFKLGNDRPGRLLLIVHHLVVDGVSWRILLEDLATAYQQLQQTQTIQLPPKTTSFQNWAIRLQDYGRSLSCQQELNYWLAQCDLDIRPIPVDYPTGLAANTVGSTEETTVFLSAAETTALLEKVPSVYNTQINDVLLTALVQTFAQWTGNCALLVELEGHGREELFEDVYLSRTVGWFTSIYPVRLELSAAFDLGVALKSIKEQLRRIPNRGIGYGILRYLSQNAEIRKKLQDISISQICFNYLGQLDQVLSSNIWQKFAQENPGQGLSPLGKRSYLLDVVGSVVAGKLQMTWFYNRNIHRRATIEGLANEYNSVLRSLIAHCQSSEGGGYTPTDFPLVDLSQEDLDDLLSKIDLS